MTDFIPAPDPNTNDRKQMHPDFFSAGQKVKVDVTATADGRVNDGLSDSAYVVDYTIDRRPMLQSGFATQSMSTDTGDETGNLNSNTMGQPSENYRKTPITGADMTDPNTNGRLKWVNDKLLTDVCPQFERFVIFNPAGFSNVNQTSRYYPSNPITGMDLDQVALYFNETTQYSFSPVASPFTDTGLEGGTFGDSREAWTAAITELKDTAAAAGGTNLEVNCYAGFHPVYTDDTLATPIRDSLGYDPSWSRSPKPVNWDDSYWRPELEGAQAIGFTGFSYDAGTWVGFLEDVKGSFRGPASSYFPKTFYEAIPFFGGSAPGGAWTYDGGASSLPADEKREWRASDGDTFPVDDTIYRGTAYWGFHGIIFGDATHETGVGPYIENVNFDPATTEVHILFDWNRLASSSRLNLTGFEIRKLMWTAHQNGLIVGVSGGESPPQTNGDAWTCAEFRQYALDLHAGTADNPNSLAGVSLRSIGLSSGGTDNYLSGNLDSYYLQGNGFYDTLDASDVLSSQKFSFMGFTSASVKETDASGNGTFNWDSSSSLVGLRGLSDGDFTLEVNELRDQIKDDITTQLNSAAYDLTALQASGNHFILDPEFVCFDEHFFREPATHYLSSRSKVTDTSGFVVYDGASTATTGLTRAALYYDTDTGVLNTARVAAVVAAMNDIAAHVRSFGIPNVSWYNNCGFYSVELARAMNLVQGGATYVGNTAEPSDLRTALTNLITDTNMAPFYADQYSYNMRFYPNGIDLSDTTWEAMLGMVNNRDKLGSVWTWCIGPNSRTYTASSKDYSDYFSSIGTISDDYTITIGDTSGSFDAAYLVPGDVLRWYATTAQAAGVQLLMLLPGLYDTDWSTDGVLNVQSDAFWTNTDLNLVVGSGYNPVTSQQDFYNIINVLHKKMLGTWDGNWPAAE